MAVVLAFAALGAGCRSEAALRQEARDRAERDASLQRARDLDTALNDLEARLYSGRSTVKLWSELHERHGKVTELACKNAEMHAMGIAEAARKDMRTRARVKTVVANQHGIATDAEVTGYKTKSVEPRAKVSPAGRLAP